jgi:DNA segregation ATPase FtsK/SpoIIIE-like protein
MEQTFDQMLEQVTKNLVTFEKRGREVMLVPVPYLRAMIDELNDLRQTLETREECSHDC